MLFQVDIIFIMGFNIRIFVIKNLIFQENNYSYHFLDSYDNLISVNIQNRYLNIEQIQKIFCIFVDDFNSVRPNDEVS